MTEFLFIVAFQSIFATFCAYVAGQKNRDRVTWFLLGLCTGLIALIAVAGLPVATPRAEAAAERDPSRPSDMYWLGSVVGRLFGRRR